MTGLVFEIEPEEGRKKEEEKFQFSKGWLFLKKSVLRSFNCDLKIIASIVSGHAKWRRDKTWRSFKPEKA